MQTSEQVFSNVIQQATNITHSDNGDVAYRSTLSSCLDLYGSMGALRGRTEEFLTYFKSAVKENPETAIALLLKLRDIKNGLGERELFKSALTWLVNESGIKIKLSTLFGFVSEHGRYDDLMIDGNDEYLGKLSHWYMYRIVILITRLKENNLDKKEDEKHFRLMLRWIKRNPKEKHLKRFNHLLRKVAKLDHKSFRKLIKQANSPEQLMSSKQWDKLVYEHLPSRTMLKFNKAFKRNDGERYNEYLLSLSKGEKKVNASTLYPYDIYQRNKLMFNIHEEDNVLLNEQWKALPNYFDGLDKVPTILPVLDISSSMLEEVSGSVTAMDISQSLGVYLSQRNPGLLNNICMIFAEDSYFIQLPEGKLEDIYRFINKQKVGYTTDYDKMYQNVLEASLKLKQAAKDANVEFVPIDVLLIISDMNFNQSQSYGSLLRNKHPIFDKHAHERLKDAFDKEGIPMPKLVFWNVNHNGTFTCTVEDNNVCQLSGFSPSSIRDVLPIIDKINPVLVMEKGIEKYLPIAKEILNIGE